MPKHGQDLTPSPCEPRAWRVSTSLVLLYRGKAEPVNVTTATVLVIESDGSRCLPPACSVLRAVISAFRALPHVILAPRRPAVSFSRFTNERHRHFGGKSVHRRAACAWGAEPCQSTPGGSGRCGPAGGWGITRCRKAMNDLHALNRPGGNLNASY